MPSRIPTLSSALFFIPAYLAYINATPLLSLACAACAVTSLINHGTLCIYTVFGYIDRLVVNSIGALYALNCIKKLKTITLAHPSAIFYLSTLIFGALTIYLYAYLTQHAHYRYHAFIHLSAVVGILFYLQGELYIREYLSSKDEYARARSQGLLS
jgi:hypothetical protein